MQQQTKSWIKKNILALITIPLSVGIMAYFLMREKGTDNLQVFLHLDPIWVMWTFLGALGGWFLEGYVLYLICKHLCKDWTYAKSFYVGMVGLFYSALTPFCMGEPMEVYSMTKMGMETGTASSIIAVKSLIHHAVTFFYSFILVAFELNYFMTKVTNFSLITLFGLVTNSIFIIAVIMFMVNEKLTDTILKFFINILNKFKMHKLAQKLYENIHNQLQIFHDSSKRIGKANSLYAVAIVLTLVQITLASLVSYFVYRSFFLNGESVFTMVAGDTFVTMAASFVPLPGSSGGAEGGFYLFFREFFGGHILPGITLWRFATYYLNIFLGCFIVNFGKKKYHL